MSKERFVAVAGGLRWATIEGIVERLDEADYWEEGFDENAVQQKKKQHVRDKIKRLKDESGFPIFASVEETDEDGETVRVYKQEEFFDPDDYKKAAYFHAGRAKYHDDMAVGYKERGERRYGVQIPLPFEEGYEVEAYLPVE